jgi:hypothetical protein
MAAEWQTAVRDTGHRRFLQRVQKKSTIETDDFSEFLVCSPVFRRAAAGSAHAGRLAAMINTIYIITASG